MRTPSLSRIFRCEVKMNIPIFSLLVAGAAISLLLHATAEGGVSVLPVELWCVAKNNADDSALQEALDWACGQGASDCRPIVPGGRCYDATDLPDRASYAFNDYYLRHNLTPDSCDFSNTAALTSLNPSHDKCTYPSSFAVSKGRSGVQSTVVGMSPPTTDLSSNGWISGRAGCASTAISVFFTMFLRCR